MRPRESQGGKTEVPEDQGIVGDGVDQDAGCRDVGDHVGLVESRDEHAQHHDPQHRSDARQGPAQIDAGAHGILGILAELEDQAFGKPIDRGQRHHDDSPGPKTLADRAADAPRLIGAARLGHQRGHSGHDAETEGDEGKLKVDRQRRGGQRLRAEPAHHDDVRGPNRDLTERCQHQRQGKRESRLGFGNPKSERAQRLAALLRPGSGHNLGHDGADYASSRERRHPASLQPSHADRLSGDQARSTLRSGVL